MSVEDSIIDVVSISPDGAVVLTVSDHLEWDERNEHLLILQNKLNLYLDAIGSGSLFESYPNAVGRQIVIHVYLKYFPNEDGEEFLIRTGQQIESFGHRFTFTNFIH